MDDADAIGTVGYAILGVLARGPLTGYALSQRMRQTVAYFWSARHSQIYPRLTRLEADGLVEHETTAGPGPRPKKTYRLTPAGRAALRAWVVQSPTPAPSRDEDVLKAYCCWVADPDAMAELFGREADGHRGRLAVYRQFAAELREAHGDALDHVGSPAFGNWSALQRGIWYEEHCVRWCEWMVARLTDRPSATVVSGRGKKGPQESR